MSRHDSRDHRCARCQMHRSLCICAALPCLRTRTRLVLIMHQLEARKTTNTGRIAALCLADSRIVMRGRDDHGPPVLTQTPAPLWDAGTQPVLLFPHESAQPIETWRDAPVPVSLIVPDGTWSQAIRARKRLAGLGDVPCAALPDSSARTAARFRLRHDGRPGRLSTLAAIAIALGVLEDAGVQQALERALAMMVDRTLWTNGRIRSADVTGGIPEGVQSHDPLGRGQRDVV